MGPAIGVAALAVLLASALLTRLMRKIALACGVLDLPNERSSHRLPTPRGGGAAIVVASTGACAALLALNVLDLGLAMALIGGGSAVAVIGFLDDRRSVPARVRLTVHVSAAAWAVWWLGGMPSLQIGSTMLTLGSAGFVLCVLGICWVLNLFNFMDGIDGIAGSEAVFIALAGAVLTWSCGASMAVAAVGLVFGAACAGFLVWNWPPAKIFMGDVGSGYLGYVIGVLALAAARSNPSALWVWLILGGVFLVDATATLLRRILRGDRVYEAHRSHAYQWLSRRWNSHKSVTLAISAVNVIWLLPCAWFATQNPPLAAWTALVALAPVTLATVAAGAGQRESN